MNGRRLRVPSGANKSNPRDDAVLELCDREGAAAWCLAAGARTILAQNGTALRWRRARPVNSTENRLEALLADVVMDDHGARSTAKPGVLRRLGRQLRTPPGCPAWFRDRELGWVPIRIAVLDQPGEGGARGALWLIMRRRPTPGGLGSSEENSSVAFRQLFAATAHELNNVLVAVEGFGALAADLAVAAEDPLRGYLAEFQIAGGRLRRLSGHLAGIGVRCDGAFSAFPVAAWLEEQPVGNGSATLQFQWHCPPATRLLGDLPLARSALTGLIGQMAAPAAGRPQPIHVRKIDGATLRCQGCGAPLASSLVAVSTPLHGLEHLRSDDLSAAPRIAQRMDRGRALLLSATLDLMHRAGGHVLALDNPGGFGLVLPIDGLA